ncbi:MAG: NAD(P)/FAD-dependent oxidoreductase [Sandaracinaceae bacterium]
MSGVVKEVIEADVAILGAGPAGTAAAAHLGSLGVRNVVLVDRHDFPRDKTCGSGISPRGIGVLKELGVWDQIEPHAYRISGIRIVTPGGRDSWQSAGDVAEAVVCKRRVLDNLLLEKALAAGTRFIPHFDASEAIEEGGRMVGFRARDGREVRAKLTLQAGGSHCRVGLPELRPRRTIQAIMGWWDDAEFRPNHVEMIFDRMIEPYYGWLFPESETRVNIGITYEDPPGAQNGSKKNARALFDQFLDKYYRDRLKNATQVGAFKGHPVVWSYKIDRLTAPGRIAIGETGLMTHPATAEGIYQGMKSGMLGAEAAADILSGRRSQAEAFDRYEKACVKAFQISFWGGGVFRKLVKTDALDWLIAATDQPIVQSVTAKLMANM